MFLTLRALGFSDYFTKFIYELQQLALNSYFERFSQCDKWIAFKALNEVSSSVSKRFDFSCVQKVIHFKTIINNLSHADNIIYLFRNCQSTKGKGMEIKDIYWRSWPTLSHSLIIGVVTINCIRLLWIVFDDITLRFSKLFRTYS